MERNFWGRATEVCKVAVIALLICLLGEALFAVFVRAFAPADWVITLVNWSIQAVAILLSAFLFLQPDRILIKGIIAGILSVVLTMLVFAILAGGFYLTAFFFVKVLLGGGMGALGGIFHAILRKE